MEDDGLDNCGPLRLTYLTLELLVFRALLRPLAYKSGTSKEELSEPRSTIFENSQSCAKLVLELVAALKANHFVNFWPSCKCIQSSYPCSRGFSLKSRCSFDPFHMDYAIILISFHSCCPSDFHDPKSQEDPTLTRVFPFQSWTVLLTPFAIEDTRYQLSYMTNFALLLFVQSPSMSVAKENKILLDKWRSTIRMQSRAWPVLKLAVMRLDAVLWKGLDNIVTWAGKDSPAEILLRKLPNP